jgi:hypothetical protein
MAGVSKTSLNHVIKNPDPPHRNILMGKTPKIGNMDSGSVIIVSTIQTGSNLLANLTGVWGFKTIF